ncbi:MAG: hypothetical protein WCI97_05150 [Bacteroidota bacterium]
MKKKSKKKDDTAKVNPELEGLDIRFNKFGQLISSVSLDELNGFLNKNVKDRKLEEKFENEAKAKAEKKITKKK